MSFLIPFRRLKALTKRIFGDLIIITETLIVSLAEVHVYVTDTLNFVSNYIFKVLTIDNISILDKVRVIINPAKTISIQDVIGKITIRIREPLAIIKSSILKFYTKEILSISEGLKLTLLSALNFSITELIGINLRAIDTLSTVKSSIWKFYTKEVISIGEGLKLKLLSVKTFTLNELIFVVISIVESLAYTSSSVFDVKTAEPISIGEGFKIIGNPNIPYTVTDSYIYDLVTAGKWTEKYQELNMSGMTNFVWAEFDLNSLYGVPGDAVVLMALVNVENASDNALGVRTAGSALSRYLNIQEAEDGGDGVLTMFSQTDGDGKIEIYTSDILETDIVLMGYLEGCTYTELTRNQYIEPTPDAAWHTVGHGDYSNRVCDISLENIHNTSEREVGVRESGSSLIRLFDVMEREAAGTAVLGNVLVQADGDGNFEAYREDANSLIEIWGYFSANVSFTEAFTDELVGGTSGSWEEETVTPPASISQFVITNMYTLDEYWGGIRERGSSLERRFNLRESEGGGLNGYGDLVNVDGDQVIENYIETGTWVDLWYTGYLTIA